MISPLAPLSFLTPSPPSHHPPPRTCPSTLIKGTARCVCTVWTDGTGTARGWRKRRTNPPENYTNVNAAGWRTNSDLWVVGAVGVVEIDHWQRDPWVLISDWDWNVDTAVSTVPWVISECLSKLWWRIKDVVRWFLEWLMWWLLVLMNCTTVVPKSLWLTNDQCCMTSKVCIQPHMTGDCRDQRSYSGD